MELFNYYYNHTTEYHHFLKYFNQLPHSFATAHVTAYPNPDGNPSICRTYS